MQATHTFALLKQREIDACVALARDAVREWETGWSQDATFHISCSPACDGGLDLANEGWRAHGMTDDTSLWCQMSATFSKQIESLIFRLNNPSRNKERRSDSDIAGSVAAEATEDLIATLLKKVNASAAMQKSDATQPPRWLLRRSAGTALLNISSGGQALQILIPNALLPGSVTPVSTHERAPLAPLSTALTGTVARLTAELGEVDITLGQLTSLAVGDVLSLSVGIDQPLKIFAGKHHLVGLGHLGKQDGYRALEMFAAPKR